jgi:hypothetical protein
MKRKKRENVKMSISLCGEKMAENLCGIAYLMHTFQALLRAAWDCCEDTPTALGVRPTACNSLYWLGDSLRRAFYSYPIIMPAYIYPGSGIITLRSPHTVTLQAVTVLDFIHASMAFARWVVPPQQRCLRSVLLVGYRILGRCNGVVPFLFCPAVPSGLARLCLFCRDYLLL